MWNFPGGMKEEGESHADAAIRELYEEFEIVLKRDALELITVFSHEHARDDHVYLAAVPDERIPAIHEGADAQWKTLEQIKQLQLGFSQERLVPHIERAVTGCEPSEQ
jgi:8-oxo-dGTP diphosphatase